MASQTTSRQTRARQTSCVQSTQNANNSKTLQELDAVKNENHTLQQELQAARVHYTELQKELKAIREERDSLKLALQIVSKDLYHKSFVMQTDNIRVDTEYQDAQDFVLVGKKKRRPVTNETSLRQTQTQTGDIRIRGVPHSSILGSTCSLIYINNLPNCLLQHEQKCSQMTQTLPFLVPL